MDTMESAIAVPEELDLSVMMMNGLIDIIGEDLNTPEVAPSNQLQDYQVDQVSI